MKYIKLFEDLTSSGYEQITRNQFLGDSREQIKPNQKYTSILEGMGFEWWYETSLYFEMYLTKKQFKGHRKLYEMGINSVAIYCYDDEWYQVNATFKPYDNIGEDIIKCYNCDQFDGLTNCLKNEFGIE